MENNIYIVQEGDNLYDIAEKNHTTIGIIKALNDLKSNILTIGQTLKLPNSPLLNAKVDDYIIYTIKNGDSLYNIAKNYHITLEELINFNEQGTTLLNIGDQLLIPIKTNNKNLTYIVKPGDTLYNLAKRYNVKVEDLKNLNNLDSNLLKIGESLLIPETSNYKTYIVQKNDTLSSIAMNFKVDSNDIKRINNLLTDDILEGQILLLP